MWNILPILGTVWTFMVFPIAELKCATYVESVNCTQKDEAHLLYTCESAVDDADCSCFFENPLLTDNGWYKTCKSKLSLKLKKKKVRKRQLSDELKCPAIQPPKPGKVSCSVSPTEIRCLGTCDVGHIFVDDSKELPYFCSYSEGLWSPTDIFPPCKPVCQEACQNGGNCTAVDYCTCPNEYRGSTCQYPITLCSISKNLLASSWHCNHTRSETLCDVSCHAPDTEEATAMARRYVCSVQGEWTPQLPPCVQVLQCLEPHPLPNGDWRLLIGKNFVIGSRVTYFCADGFQLLGSDFAVCLSNATWSHETPRCERRQDVFCNDPGDIPFGRRVDQRQTFIIGSSVSYNCAEKYSLVGTSVITCQQDGRWSSRKPQCVSDLGFTALCPKPNVPKNALVSISYPNQHPLRTFFNTDISLAEKLYLISSAHQYTENDDSFPVGTRVQYRCKSRFYKLYGSEYQTCLSSRTWSGYQPACVPDCGRSDAPRTPFIVNGNASEMGHWPWQVGMTLKGPRGPQLICGAVLISELWALTAAHCVTKKFSSVAMEPNELLLFCGKFYRNFAKDDEYVQVRQVKQIVINEEYDFIHFDGDIALLQLETPVELTSRVRPICLPTEETTRENIRDGKRGIVLGWGLTENGTFSESLRETILPIVGHDRCEEAYREGLRSITITRNMFCAGHDTGLSDTCNGDSGGPFLFSAGPANDHRWYLEGLVSWGSESGCGKAKHYSGFTKVGRFVPWINMFI